jgi:hypothetical protein
MRRLATQLIGYFVRVRLELLKDEYADAKEDRSCAKLFVYGCCEGLKLMLFHAQAVTPVVPMEVVVGTAQPVGGENLRFQTAGHPHYQSSPHQRARKMKSMRSGNDGHSATSYP